MKIHYEFVTGEKLELEVDDSIDEIVIELEVSQSRRNRTETRRHHSLESMQEVQSGHSSRQFVDETADVEQFVVDSDERERLHQAISQLEDRDAIVCRYYFENKTMQEIGREIGISAMAVSKRLKKIPEKLKGLMS